MKLHPPILKGISLMALDDFAKDPDHCLSYSPFGLVETGGTMFTKDPPVAKGVAYADLPKKIKDGLDKAIKMSKGHTEKGVVVRVVRGRLKRLPRKAYMMHAEKMGIKVKA